MSQTTKAPKAPEAPCILGILSSDALSARRYPASLWSCGGVELRADGMPADAIAGAVADFDNEKAKRGFTGPVVFTLRLCRDGGTWPDAEAGARNAVWESLPPGTCDWVDLEVEEAGRIDASVFDNLRSSGAGILLSHHAFVPEEPAVWDSLLDTMRALNPDGVKFAVSLRDGEDGASAVALLRLARRVAAEYTTSSVLGMGAAGSLTRLISPMLGCPLTYGYIGATPVAPGQLAAADMRAFFASARGNHPDLSAAEEVWLDWAEELWARVRDA